MPEIKFKSKHYLKFNKKYLKINRNQMLILDALLNDGGMTKKYLDSKKNLRYSEHAGLLDFDSKKLEKVIISGKTNREDYDDLDILLPQDLNDIIDYEFIFHTHPPTPYPGGRASSGILYEFPSISDIFHFIYYFNKGITQGSIIIAPEGIYVIKAKNNIEKILYDNKKENEIYDKLSEGQFNIQSLAIDKYGTNFTSDEYFKKIVQDKTYIKKFNKLVNKFLNNQLKIIYKPRTYDKISGQWIIKSLYLSVRAIEPIQKNK